MRRNAVALDFGRQLRERLIDPVGDIDGVEVGVATDLEGHVEGVTAVAARGRLHIDHVVDAVDLGFDDLRDAFFDGRRRRPGIKALTSTCGGTMSGNCAIGSAPSAITPAIEMTIAMTIASRGRWMKTEEIIEYRPELLSRPATARAAALQSSRRGCAAAPARRRVRPAAGRHQPPRDHRGWFRRLHAAGRPCRPDPRRRHMTRFGRSRPRSAGSRRPCRRPFLR